MAFQSLRRAAAAPARRSAFRYLVPQQQQQLDGLVPVVRASASMAATEAKFCSWSLRMSSVAREVGRDSSDGGLISVLRSELDHERKTYHQAKEVAKGPPKPWTLTDKQGHADVILRRSYGKEDIAVTCVYQSDKYNSEKNEDDDDMDNDDMDRENDGIGDCLTMSITINKGDVHPTLEISAASYGTEVTIEHVYFWEEKDNKDAVYDGPNFLQMDEEVQNQFEKYIKARGVNRELTGYLFSLMADKEQREYMRWLQKVEGFLKQ